MKEKITPENIWSEYQKGITYLTENNVYNTVKKNEDFFCGRHWEGMADNVNIAKPTMNILQRIGKYQIAMLSSNDVGISIKSLTGNQDENERMKYISNEVKEVIEQDKIIENARIAIRNAYVGGSCYMHQSFDPDFETGQDSKGKINNELVNCRRIIFGNPYSNNIQKQPYIMVILRQYVDQVKEEARDLGVSEDIIDNIRPDANNDYDNDKGDKLVTVILKYYKKKSKVQEVQVITDEFGNQVETIVEKEVRSVWFTKSTQHVLIKDETNLGYTRYPISRFGWDVREDSYLFDTPMTWNIVNQVFINKSYAYCHEYAFKSAFPKRIYDVAKMDLEDWDSASDIGVAGADLMGKYLDFSKMPDFSNQIIELIKTTESEMEKNMGVNDAALGNIKPDNAKAIIATQEAAAVPLEIQRQNFYEMWEDTIRNIIDIMITSYGYRKFYDEELGIVDVDFNLLKGLNYRLNIDISSSAQYSEISQLDTLSNLFKQRSIDLYTFLKACPDKFVPQKELLLKYAEEVRAAQQQMAQQPIVPQIQ